MSSEQGLASADGRRLSSAHFGRCFARMESGAKVSITKACNRKLHPVDRLEQGGVFSKGAQPPITSARFADGAAQPLNLLCQRSLQLNDRQRLEMPVGGATTNLCPSGHIDHRTAQDAPAQIDDLTKANPN